MKKPCAFGGQFGFLDYAFANASMTAQVSGSADWHINSDEPIVLDYNTNFKSVSQQTSLYAVDPFKASDHDPVLVGLNLVGSLTATVAVSPTSVCPGSPVSLTSTVANFGASYSYTLTNGTNSTLATAQTSASFVSTIMPTVPGAFTLTVRGADGLTTVAVSASVIVNALPQATLQASSIVFCSGNSVTLTAGGGTSFSFTGPGFNQNDGRSTAVVSQSGTYLVRVTDANGCSNTASIGLTEIASNTTFSLPATVSTVCAGSSFSLPAMVNGSASSFQWYKNGVLLSNQTSATLTLGNVQTSDAGSYSLVVNGGCGSIGSSTFVLTMNSQPTITLTFPGGTLVVTGLLPTIQLPTPGQALVSASGGVSYNWVLVIERINGYEIRKTDNNTSGSFTIDRPGPYRVTVVGSNGCSRTVNGLIVN